MDTEDKVKVKVTQLCLNLCDPMDCTIRGILQTRILEWVAIPFHSPGDLPNPGIEPRFPALQADSLPAEPPGKPKNTGVGSLSLLQRIFSTQESNWGLLHCRQILYQLSYQVSPVACQAPLSVEFPRQEYWKGLPFPSPGDLPHPGVVPGSPALPAETSPSEPSGKDIEDKENKQILGDRRGCT